MMLRLSGHEVEVVFDGASVVGAVSHKRPDLILLDIGLPDIDGYEVARRVRALQDGARDILVVAVTGYGRPDDVRRSREAGIDEHLTKPVDPDALAAIMQRVRKNSH